jgi:spore coat protein U-like protein
MNRLFLIAVGGSALFAVPAQAADTTVTFSGSRAVECSVTGYTSAINFGNLGRNGEASPVTDDGINVFCNQPFLASLTSQNGYLKLQTTNLANNSASETNFTSVANPQFDAGLDYGIVIPGISTPQGSQYLNASTPAAGGPIPAVNLSGLTATYNTVTADKPLLGGTYSDTVTLTLTPQGV